MRLTVAQALVRFLAAQHVERDGVEQRLIAGCFGIFGHGNVAGIGQALLQEPGRRLPYYQARNEQAMVHAAAGYARMRNRLSTLACTTSIGPGRDEHGHRRGARDDQPPAGPAAAGRHVRHARRRPGAAAARGPDARYDVSVNDCFQPVSRYWDRIERPEQLAPALLAAMRVLTDPADTGAVTLALPQDVQAEAFDWPDELFERRVWRVAPAAARAARRWPRRPRCCAAPSGR